jgi:hypothetical protein
MDTLIFACFSKKMYYYSIMKKALVVFLFAVVGFTQAQAQNYKLHPLYIFSFTRYIQWPDSYNQGDFEIDVLGDSPIIEELNKMAQAKKVGERVIKVVKINSVADIKKCHMLFVPSAKSGQLADVLAKVGSQSILVISEDPGLATKGSNINFVTKDGKLAFELNQATISKQNMKVSNELTRLAILI